MSVVTDQVRRIDAHIDRILLKPLAVPDDSDSEEGNFAISDDGTVKSTISNALKSPRVIELQTFVRKLSASPETTFPAWRLKDLLRQSRLTRQANVHDAAADDKTHYETELEWIVVSKLTTQTYGLVLNSLLDRLSPLSDHIWYWDQILGSYSYSSLYTIQTLPIRWWRWSQEIYQETRMRSSISRRASLTSLRPLPAQETFSERWRQFYDIVRETIAERSVRDLQRRMLSPIALCRKEAKQKQSQLKKLKDITASGLGVLMDEGLSFNGHDEKAEMRNQSTDFKVVVERSVALMDMVLEKATNLELKVTAFEDKVFAGVEEDPDLAVQTEDVTDKPGIVARRLLDLLQQRLPEHERSMHTIVAKNGIPSRLTRYWLPAGVLLISSSTLLRIVARRQAEVLQWIADIGTTARDFWFNWIIQPIRKVIGTIRHDSNSEIAIMSKDSLKADRESLQRMVVDFASDNPTLSVGASNISETQIAEIREKVREGDVTPVLRAYERDLRKPFVGAIKGDLVRALLIQVQKTKVDLEVAISGIDALLKSQELVFGFVGLTPGILVSIAVLSYVPGIVFGTRRGVKQRGQQVGRCMRVLRNMDRVLSEARAATTPVLSYKDKGLLLSEVHVLRALVHDGRLMPRATEQDFLEDLDDLANSKGVQIQVRALERIRWAYAKWL